MLPTRMKAIMADIDKHAEGDGVAVWLKLRDGTGYHGTVEFLPGKPDIIVLSLPDTPPIYIDTDAIMVVSLWTGK